jgi:alpha-tubulin suppressor-like RCC1 family protein
MTSRFVRRTARAALPAIVAVSLTVVAWPARQAAAALNCLQVDALAAGFRHVVSLKADGTVWGWGYNSNGQLGDGSTADRGSPVRAGTLSGVTKVAAGWYHSLALKSDGTVWAWGANPYGQLGDGTNNQRTSPVQVSGLTGVVAIAAGFGHSLAVKSDGTVWAWGYNGDGQLGDGTTTSRNIPALATGVAGATAVAAGIYHSLALGSTGTVSAWGYNAYGQLGDGSTTNRSVAVAVSGLSTATRIAAGAYHSLARKSDGTVAAWGENGFGQLGNGSWSNSSSPVQVSGLTGVTDLSAGYSHSLAVRTDGTVRAWGGNNYGELGDGTRTYRTTPIQTPGVTGTAAVAAGGHFSLARRTDGTIVAWGAGENGQLGDDGTDTRRTPVAVAGLTGAAGSVDGGGGHSLAVRTDGTVRSWGTNDQSQLGDGTTTRRTTPVQVAGLTGVTTLAAGEYHGLAIRTDGTVRAWGYNGFGQLGDGTTTNRGTPVPVSGLSGVTAVAAGWYHSLAVKSDGTVWAWGYNGSGQLGDGTTSQRTAPVQVSGLTGVTAIAARGDHSLARKSDGTVWAWGRNAEYQLGDGTTSNRSTPVQVTGLTGASAVAAGTGHSLAVKTDGTVWGWGDNSAGQLGDGTGIDRTNPVQVSGLTGVTAVAAGSNHSLARKSDGTLRAWGDNGFGQVGDGSTTWARYSPVQVSGITSATAIGAGTNHSLAVLSDGTARGWGHNVDGQIGDGTAGRQFDPISPGCAVLPPTLVAPATGGRFGQDAAKVFTIRTTTANGSAYTGTVTIRNASNGSVVQAVTTPATASGAEASVSATLSTGSYTWEAYATDAGGASSPVSAARAFSVGVRPATPTHVAPTAGTRLTTTSQVFTVRSSDGDGDQYSATITVRDAATSAVVRTFTTSTVPSNANVATSPSPLLPSGSYTWSAVATDTTGDASAASTPVAFSVNTLPTAPALVSPAAGGTVPVEGTQTFTVNATDANGDGYVGRITVRNASTGSVVTTFDTPRVASGANASATPPSALPSGAYTWTAVAIDDLGESGTASASRAVSVPFKPGAPLLLSPAAGAKFGVGAAQVFTVRATDNDGDAYSATVTVRDTGGNVVATFTTPQVASGTNASASPVTPLASGAYTWSAVATDATGLSGPAAAASPFAVAYRPGVPTLTNPGAGQRIAETGQTFMVRVVDNDGDAYTATITVKDSGGNVVRTFTTGSTPSGGYASAGPATPLPPGAYTWSAYATDATGAVGSESSARAFTVGRRPDTAVLVAPADGAEIAAGAPQAFSVRATDEDSSTYSGVVTIRKASDGSFVTTLQSAHVPIGSTATVSPPSLLPAGEYLWSAHARDDEGNNGPESAQRSFTVRLASDECTTGPVFDGYAGESYVRTRVHQAGPSTTWVCLRVDAGDALNTGGKLVLTRAALSGTPTSDANALACSVTPGNTMPGPHPLYRGSVGDPTDPSTYTSYA